MRKDTSQTLERIAEIIKELPYATLCQVYAFILGLQK